MFTTLKKQRKASLSSRLICMNTNLITLQAVCHANHAITKFQHVSTAHHEKSFTTSLSQAFADVVTHAAMGH